MKFNPGSTRLAFFLIAPLLVLIIISAIIPQYDISTHRVTDWQDLLGDYYSIIDSLGLDRIYTTPAFFTILALLAINLLFGNIKRFRIIYRSERTLIRARHIGSILFHFSLLLIMSGVILNYLFKFTGVFALTEGQKVEDRPDSYHSVVSGPFYHPTYRNFSILLDSVTTNYDVHGSPTEALIFSLWPGRAKSPYQPTIHTNNPFEWQDIEFHYGLNYGYSPELAIIDSNSTVLFRSFVRTATQKRSGETKYQDFLIRPELDLKFDIELFPTDSGIIRNNIVVESGHDTLYNGPIKSTDTIVAGQYRIAMPRLRYWGYIDVVRSPYLSVVFVGFWLALSGMMISLIARIVKK